MQQEKPSVTEHLANEQTFLAWLRTGIEVMAFGIVAIKFSLFASQVMGLVLVGAAIVMIALSYIRYYHTVKQLRKQQFGYSGKLAAVTAVLILSISAILLYCLLDGYVNHPEAFRKQSQKTENTLQESK